MDYWILTTINFQEDYLIYPDMAAYHSIAVTLGQSGLVKELLNIVECMRQKPYKKIRNMRRKNWDRSVEPDVVIFNAVCELQLIYVLANYLKYSFKSLHIRLIPSLCFQLIVRCSMLVCHPSSGKGYLGCWGRWGIMV